MEIGTNDDWMQAERRHEREMAELARKERADIRHQRTERITTITIGVTVVLVVATLSFLLWRLVADSTNASTERDRICAEAGGTRAAINGGGTVCIHIGEQEPG